MVEEIEGRQTSKDIEKSYLKKEEKMCRGVCAGISG